MVVVQAQKIPEKERNSADILASFCYFYQRYSYHEAKKLPYKRVIQLLNTARAEQAREWYNLLMIATAPHAKKGTAQKLAKQYLEIIKEAGL